jgi:hypothetical protein
MMLSSAGVGEFAANAILILPVKQAGFAALMLSCGSVLIKLHTLSSITKVKEPAAFTLLVMVKLIADGGGE